MWAWESTEFHGKRIRTAVVSEGTTNRYLFQSRADFYVFEETGQDRAAFRADGGGDDHAVGFDAAEFAGREIGDYGDFATDKGFGFVKLRDACADLADFGADVYGELQEFVGAYDAFGGFDLTYAHFDFGEIFDADFFAGAAR